MAKRDQVISIKATTDDVRMFQQAADKLWPGAPITRSSAVLALARLGAESVLRKKKD